MSPLPTSAEAFPTDGDLAWWAPLSVLRPAVDARLPAPGAPLRVAFVGQRTYFEVCAQLSASPVVEPTFVEFRSGSDPTDLLRRLDRIDPHVVVMFRPEIVPAATLHELRAIKIGFLTEPLPRAGDDSHPDLARRLQDLSMVDESQFDRFVVFDPGIADAAGRYLPVWRSQPLPVADEVFVDVLDRHAEVRSLFVGRTTPHREQWLLPLKHMYDLMHVEHGVYGTALVDLARQFLIAVNIHNAPYPSFENRVPLHLAIGNLVISEPLSPSNGLDAGFDYLEASTPDDLVSFVGLITEDPAQFEWMRLRGRQKAEAFRASRVYARLLLDALFDIAEFGRRR